MAYEPWPCPVCGRPISSVQGGGLRSHTTSGKEVDPECLGTGYSIFEDHLEQMAARGLDGRGQELED